ncbi:hypothetical protein CSB11_00150, partial [Candidatus Campbellbacteria bacterium]
MKKISTKLISILIIIQMTFGSSVFAQEIQKTETKQGVQKTQVQETVNEPTEVLDIQKDLENTQKEQTDLQDETSNEKEELKEKLKEELKDQKEKPKEDDKEKPKTQAKSASSPDSAENQNQNQAKHKISDFDGSLNYNYGIELPKGRNGLTPNIVLSYKSSDKSLDSIVAKGWSISIPYIQRINKKGTNNLYTQNYFSSSIDGELVEQENGIYTPRVENGSFLKYQYTNNTWTITDKTGTIYEFGKTENSKQDNPENTEQVYKWYLEKTTDTNGNTISYTYFKDAGQIYPDTISYNQSGIFKIQFNRSAKERTNTSYKTAFKVQTNYRIDKISILINDEKKKEYNLNIQNNLIKDIQESGFENGSEIKLPKEDFDYINKTVSGFIKNDNFLLPTDSNNKVIQLNSHSSYKGTFFQDVNG